MSTNVKQELQKLARWENTLRSIVGEMRNDPQTDNLINAEHLELIAGDVQFQKKSIDGLIARSLGATNFMFR